MGKFDRGATALKGPRSPITSTAKVADTVTYNRGQGYTRDAKSELFLLAVTNFVSEKTFYESAQARDDRFSALVQDVARQDPAWLARFIPWLRNEANMRSAAIVAACEFLAAQIAQRGKTGGSADLASFALRPVIASACQRADEPAEVIAYWTQTYGRKLPLPLKRGVADAANRLYNEWSALKYDGNSRNWRMGDVINMTHPSPTAPWQSALYRWLLDARYDRVEEIPEILGTVRERSALERMPVADRRTVLASPDTLKRAGMTWESLSGWLQGPMDKDAWTAVIPSMGYMALLRNLRNFDQAGVSDAVAKLVCDKLADPDQVARSRQLPMRFLSAYRNAPSLRWSYPLEQALQLSLANVPVLKGRSLILVDTSTSMNHAFSKDGSLMRWDAAVVFALALAARCEAPAVVSFSSAQYYSHDPRGARTKSFTLGAGESVLRGVERWKNDGYFLGGGTETALALRQHFGGHDRVLVLTDEQADRNYTEVSQCAPETTPMFTWNLAGYRAGHAPSGTGRRHAFGGLTDKAFTMVPLLENVHNGTWPF